MRSRNLCHASWLIVLGLVLGGLSPAWGQGTETEPNNTCATAKAFGAVSLPFSVTGNLENVGDVDFLRFSVTPNSLVIADLEGLETNRGTLDDPLLGLYDSSCHRLSYDDDSGEGRSSRLGFAVPADGVVIMAVTSFPDFAFTGSSAAGTYRLTLTLSSGRGLIAGSIADVAGHAINPDFVSLFTPAGEFLNDLPVVCCDGDKSTFQQLVAAGTYRIVVVGVGARSWYHDRPSFTQANDVVVADGQRVTGLDFTVSGLVRIEPTANQSSFVAGDTLRVDLALGNPSASAASVVVSVVAYVAAEPEIVSDDFCCFQDPVVLVPATTLTLPAGNHTVIHDFVTRHFTGSETRGFYDYCVNVLQGANSDLFRCVEISFGLGAAGDQVSPRASARKRP